MVPDPMQQNASIPYPVSDSARLAALEAQVALHESVPLREYRRDLAESERRFLGERDRRNSEVVAANDRRITELAAANNQRLAEVAEERAKALAIKQIADEKALDLAAENRMLRDSKADELRDKFGTEQGSRMGRDQIVTWLLGSGVVGALIATVVTYFVTHH